MANGSDDVPGAHGLAITAVAAACGVDPAVGLSEAEVDRRLLTTGRNTLRPVEREPLWRMLLESATEPFVLLLAGSGILAVLVGEVRDGLLVTLIQFG